MISMGKKYFIFRHSLFVYTATFLIMLVGVDGELIKKQYARYLKWGLTTSGFQNPRDGVLYYDSLVHLYPQDARFYFNLGHYYYELKEYDNATAAFNKAKKLSKNIQKGDRKK